MEERPDKWAKLDGPEKYAKKQRRKLLDEADTWHKVYLAIVSSEKVVEAASRWYRLALFRVGHCGRLKSPTKKQKRLSKAIEKWTDPSKTGIDIAPKSTAADALEKIEAFTRITRAAKDRYKYAYNSSVQVPIQDWDQNPVGGTENRSLKGIVGFWKLIEANLSEKDRRNAALAFGHPMRVTTFPAQIARPMFVFHDSRHTNCFRFTGDRDWILAAGSGVSLPALSRWTFPGFVFRPADLAVGQCMNNTASFLHRIMELVSENLAVVVQLHAIHPLLAYLGHGKVLPGYKLEVTPGQIKILFTTVSGTVIEETTLGPRKCPHEGAACKGGINGVQFHLQHNPRLRTVGNFRREVAMLSRSQQLYFADGSVLDPRTSFPVVPVLFRKIIPFFLVVNTGIIVIEDSAEFDDLKDAEVFAAGRFRSADDSVGTGAVCGTPRTFHMWLSLQKGLAYSKYSFLWDERKSNYTVETDWDEAEARLETDTDWLTFIDSPSPENFAKARKKKIDTAEKAANIIYLSSLKNIAVSVKKISRDPVFVHEKFGDNGTGHELHLCSTPRGGVGFRTGKMD